MWREAKKSKKTKSYQATTIGAFGDVFDDKSYRVTASSLRVFNVLCAWEALPRDDDRDRILNAFDQRITGKPGESPPDVSLYDSLVPHAVFGEDGDRVFDVCATKFYPRIRGVDDDVEHHILTAFREGETHQFIAVSKKKSGTGFVGLLDLSPTSPTSPPTFDLRTRPTGRRRDVDAEDPEVVLFYLTPFVTNARPGTYVYSYKKTVDFEAMDLVPTDAAWKTFFKDTRLAYAFASNSFDPAFLSDLRRLNGIVCMKHIRKTKSASNVIIIRFFESDERVIELVTDDTDIA